MYLAFYYVYFAGHPIFLTKRRNVKDCHCNDFDTMVEVYLHPLLISDIKRKRKFRVKAWAFYVWKAAVVRYQLNERVDGLEILSGLLGEETFTASAQNRTLIRRLYTFLPHCTGLIRLQSVSSLISETLSNLFFSR